MNARLPQERVTAYLASLRKALGGLPDSEVEDIVQELRGHIIEQAVAGSEEDQGTFERILARLGTPEEIASLYRNDTLITHARATLSPALIIGITLRCATRTILGLVSFVIGILGYAFGLLFLAGAVLKPFFPTHIGLWIHPHGFELATTNASSPTRIAHLGRELLGWWIIPICYALGAIFIVGITLFLRWMLRFIPSATRRISALIS